MILNDLELKWITQAGTQDNYSTHDGPINCRSFRKTVEYKKFRPDVSQNRTLIYYTYNAEKQNMDVMTIYNKINEY